MVIMTIKIEKFLIDSKFVREYKRDAKQYIVFESDLKKYYEIYVYKQHESDPTVFDILIEHYMIPKQLFILQ